MTERRPVVIVHLGMHKTGTTSIQHFLARHRRRLREAGILYPRAGTHGEQHAALPASVLPTHPILPPALLDSDPALVIAAVDEEIRDAGVAVLSSEVFWELLTFAPQDFDRLLALMAERWDVHLVYFARDEDDKAWSAVKHMARTGQAFDPVGFYRGDLMLTRRALDHLTSTHPDVMRIEYDPVDSVRQFLGLIVSPTILAAARGRVDEEVASVLAARSHDRRRMHRLNRDYDSPCSAGVTIGVAQALHATERRADGLTRLYSGMFRLPGISCPSGEIPTDAALHSRLRGLGAGRPDGSLLSPRELAAVRALLASGAVRRRAWALRCLPALDVACSALGAAARSG